MKRPLRLLGRGLAVVGALAAAAVLFIQLRGIPRYPVEKIDLQVDVTPARVARGKQIAENLCVLCHQDPTTRRLTGKHMTDVPDLFGEAWSKNITRHTPHGIGDWTDGELAWLLRTGIHPRTGRYVPPWMIKLPLASDEDLASVIAFLRSDDPLVAPTDVPDRGSEPSFVLRALATLVWRPLPYPNGAIRAPAASDRVAYGRYLADGLYACFACHSADFRSNDEARPERSKGYYAGGNPLLDVNGRTMVAPNLTPDVATGIGRWSEADFVRAVRDGFRPDGVLLHPPMERYVSVPEDELRAIYAYLRTLPPVARTRPASASYEDLVRGGGPGKAAYFRHGCQYCHGTTGLGSADLRRAHAKFPVDDGPIAAWILDAPRIAPGTRMPRYEGVIPAAEVGPLVRYVRELGGGSAVPMPPAAP